jgi:hypothetical protein
VALGRGAVPIQTTAPPLLGNVAIAVSTGVAPGCDAAVNLAWTRQGLSGRCGIAGDGVEAAAGLGVAYLPGAGVEVAASFDAGGRSRGDGEAMLAIGVELTRGPIVVETVEPTEGKCGDVMFPVCRRVTHEVFPRRWQMSLRGLAGGRLETDGPTLLYAATRTDTLSGDRTTWAIQQSLIGGR